LAQAGTQLPPAQASPVAQTLPQVPQLLGSVASEEQMVPH